MHLDLKGVGKCYGGKTWGVRDFSLEINDGILGLLGPNGAGKSTLMRILATVTKPTTGTVTWNGIDAVREPEVLRRVIGYLPQDFGVYPKLNPVEFLTYMAALKGISAQTARQRIDGLLQLVNLVDHRKRPLGGFSGGMKQRVGIAQALLNDPKLLIVDEPTAGLDPEERVRFRHLLTELSGERIVILSTHIVSDVESTVSAIALVRSGRLVAHLPPEELLRSVEGKVWEWTIPSTELTQARERHLISSTVRRSDGVHVRIVSDASPHSDATEVLPNLEDAYLYYMSQDRLKVAA